MQKEFSLMNKDHLVLRAVYDDKTASFTKITDVVDLRYASPAIIDNKGNTNKKLLNEWWYGRTIPMTRDGLNKTFPHITDITGTASMLEKNMGLSLSDRYWITEDSKQHKWADVNFFDNDFSVRLGRVTLGEEFWENDINMFVPDTTLNGDLRKRWDQNVLEGKRILVKYGSGELKQEPYNEVIASELYGRLLQEDDYVPYTRRINENGRCFSVCPNMLSADEELVPMWDIMKTVKKQNDQSDFRFCVSLCVKCGIPEDQVVSCFEKMFVCDYIMANHDRHYNNFGLIRNVETLKYRMAPVFDTGSSLWHDKTRLEYPSDYSYMAKPFKNNGMQPEEQLNLFHDFEWFDENRLDGFVESAKNILSGNPYMSRDRINAVIDGLERNIEVVRHISENSVKLTDEDLKNISMPENYEI